MKYYLLKFLRRRFPKFFLFMKYSLLKSKPSDINEHLKVLSEYASKCQTVFETGVRGVVSSWALLYGLSKNNHKNKKLILNDLVEVNVESISIIASALKVNFSFIKKNNLKLNFDKEESFDLTFIDTFHVYGQLKRELKKFSPITRKYIILHDTTIDGEYGEVIRFKWDTEEISKETKIPKNELLIGLWPAVNEFINENENWVIEHRYTHNNGLTVLKRINNN